MHSLASDESRKLLDAMGVPVVVLRDRDVAPSVVPMSPVTAASVDESRESGRQSAPSVSPLSALLAPSSAVAEPTPVKDESQTLPEASDEVPISAVDTVVRFSLVSVITADAMLLVELPEWASGLLDGRMTAICSDILRVISNASGDADWQYFHWPIDGMPDASRAAATEAVDAWLHRRWAEMQAPVPRILTSLQSLDPAVLTADAVLCPPITELVSDPTRKRALWEQLKTNRHANA